jgi:hypothetical protein
VLIHKVTKDRRAGKYHLHIKKVLGFKHWDKQRRKPKRSVLSVLVTFRKPPLSVATWVGSAASCPSQRFRLRAQRPGTLQGLIVAKRSRA